MPTQGSCRPWVSISTSFRLASIVRIGFGIELVGFFERVERAAVVAELALVDLRDLAEQLGALLVIDVERAAVQKIDQHRPLVRAAIEDLERLVRCSVGRRDRERALEAVGRAIRVAALLEAMCDLGQSLRRAVGREWPETALLNGGVRPSFDSVTRYEIWSRTGRGVRGTGRTR